MNSPWCIFVSPSILILTTSDEEIETSDNEIEVDDEGNQQKMAWERRKQIRVLIGGGGEAAIFLFHAYIISDDMPDYFWLPSYRHGGSLGTPKEREARRQLARLKRGDRLVQSVYTLAGLEEDVGGGGGTKLNYRVILAWLFFLFLSPSPPLSSCRKHFIISEFWLSTCLTKPPSPTTRQQLPPHVTPCTTSCRQATGL